MWCAIYTKVQIVEGYLRKKKTKSFKLQTMRGQRESVNGSSP